MFVDKTSDTHEVFVDKTWKAIMATMTMQWVKKISYALYNVNPFYGFSYDCWISSQLKVFPNLLIYASKFPILVVSKFVELEFAVYNTDDSKFLRVLSECFSNGNDSNDTNECRQLISN